MPLDTDCALAQLPRLKTTRPIKTGKNERGVLKGFKGSPLMFLLCDNPLFATDASVVIPRSFDGLKRM